MEIKKQELNLSRHPTYSICIVNYNMGRYLHQALESVLEQLDSRFEVVVVDDGSSDNSLNKLMALAQKYSSLRVFPYARDKNRLLGNTRNLSIHHATGRYVVLHIDADDIWESGIVEWCDSAKLLSEKFDDEIFISGKQINLVSRNFIINFGGYQNIFYTEDRDLWSRLQIEKKIIYIDHAVFRTRMILSNDFKFKKFFRVTWHVLQNDIRSSQHVGKNSVYILYQFMKNPLKRGWVTELLRFLLFPFAFFSSALKGPLPIQGERLSIEESVQYRRENTKTFDGWNNYIRN